MAWWDALGGGDYEAEREADLIQRQLMGGDPTLRVPPFSFGGARELISRATGGQEAWSPELELRRNAQLMADLGAPHRTQADALMDAAKASPFLNAFNPGDIPSGFMGATWGVRPQRMQNLWHGTGSPEKILDQGFRKGSSAELQYGGTSTSTDPTMSLANFGGNYPERLLRVDPGDVTAAEVRNLSPAEYALSGRAFKLPPERSSMGTPIPQEGPRAVSKPQSYFSEKEIFFPTSTGGQAQLRAYRPEESQTTLVQRASQKRNENGSDEYALSQGPYALEAGSGVLPYDAAIRDLYFQKISPAGMIEDQFQRSLASMSSTARREANTTWASRAGNWLQNPNYTDIIRRLFPEDYQTLMMLHQRHGPAYDYSGRARDDAGALRTMWDQKRSDVMREPDMGSMTPVDELDARTRQRMEPEMRAVDDTYRRATKGREAFLSDLERARAGVNASKIKMQSQIMAEVAPTLMKLPSDVRDEVFNTLQAQGMSPLNSARWIAREFKDIPPGLPNSYQTKEFIGKQVLDKLHGSPEGIMLDAQPQAGHFPYKVPMDAQFIDSPPQFPHGDPLQAPALSPQAQAQIKDIQDLVGVNPAPLWWAGDVPDWAKQQIDAGVQPHLIQVPYDSVLDIDAAQAYYNSKWGGPMVGPDKKGLSDASLYTSSPEWQQWLAKHGSPFGK